MDQLENFELDELTALARLDIEAGRVEQGLGKLKRILSGDTIPLNAVGMAARVYANIGLFDRAKQLFEQYLAIRPEAVDEGFQLGMVLFDMGNQDQALEIWEGILKRLPVFPPALFYSAVVLSRQGKIAEARRNLAVLLQTVAADNLYAERGKELLQALNKDDMQPAAVAPQAYQA